MNRVCIIALDALEYNLVKEFGLQGLMQKEYGTVDVTMFQDLSTPIVWASFITGLPPDKHGLKLPGLTTPHKLMGLVPEKLRHVLPKETRNRFFKVTRIKREQTESYGEVRQQFRNKNFRTFFDVPGSIAISVPPYQEWISTKTLGLMKKVVEKKVPYVVFEEHVRSVFLTKKKQLLDVVKRDWKLLMVHFMVTDLLAHFQIGNKQKMYQIYLQAERMVKEVKNELKKETLLLIISDHGMRFDEDLKFGEHTYHGFYSCSRKLGLTNPKITDFYSIVMNQLE